MDCKLFEEGDGMGSLGNIARLLIIQIALNEIGRQNQWHNVNHNNSSHSMIRQGHWFVYFETPSKKSWQLIGLFLCNV